MQIDKTTITNVSTDAVPQDKQYTDNAIVWKVYEPMLQGHSAACEHWTFVKDVGPYRINAANFRLPATDTVTLNTQWNRCLNYDFSLGGSYNSSLDYFSVQDVLKYSRVQDHNVSPSNDPWLIGFDSPDAMTYIDEPNWNPPMTNMLLYIKKSEYWYLDINNLKWVAHGNLVKNWNTTAPTVTLPNGTVISPTTGGGPTAIASGAAIGNIFGNNSADHGAPYYTIVFNKGGYWLKTQGQGGQSWGTSGLAANRFSSAPTVQIGATAVTPFTDGGPEAVDTDATDPNILYFYNKGGRWTFEQYGTQGRWRSGTAVPTTSTPVQNAPTKGGMKPYLPKAVATGPFYNPNYNGGRGSDGNYPITTVAQTIYAQSGQFWVSQQGTFLPPEAIGLGEK
jgi:hypothetical protein